MNLLTYGEVRDLIYARTGDVAGQSTLDKYTQTYIQDACNYLVEEIRKEEVDATFLYGAHRIDTATDPGGTSGVYTLPKDYGSLLRPKVKGNVISEDTGVNVSGSQSNTLDRRIEVVPNQLFNAIKAGENSWRRVASVFKSADGTRDELHFADEIEQDTAFDVYYTKVQPRVEDDEDLLIFPEDWRKAVYLRAAVDVWTFHQKGFDGDPEPMAERELRRKIEVMNSDTPDSSETLQLSDADVDYLLYEGGRRLF